ncbi:MAG: hypothetical protein JWO32_2043 [Bacteroidetes bacterium]|nr:hypothetical protein [Bacteroidota bacterium]
MKAVRSNKKISPHGGVVPILKKIKEYGIPQVIRSTLGTRKKQSKYGYDDIFISWVLTALCGGTRLDHITKFKKSLNIIPDLKIPSHDTLGRVMKKLATEVKTEKNISSDKEAVIRFTDYDDNYDLNRMLVKATKSAGALNEGPSYTLDIDATFIPTECRGAIRKKERSGNSDYARVGFNPMVCLIGDLPVYISMRNGDAGARFRLLHCIQDCLTILNESNIKVGLIVSDAAGYNKETFEMLESKGIKFLVRFPFQNKWKDFRKKLVEWKDWRESEINTANFNWKCEVADIPYKMHDIPAERRLSPTWRLVVMRIPTKETLNKLNKSEYDRRVLVDKKLKKLSDKKLLKDQGKSYTDANCKEIEGYEYKFFITNDHVKSTEELITAYNKRGNAERKFSFMKNDFAWRLPPFMNMNENTVFIIAAALANNIFRGMVISLKEHVPTLRLNARLGDFQAQFINVSCEYIRNGFYKFYNTDIAFEKIM